MGNIIGRATTCFQRVSSSPVGVSLKKVEVWAGSWSGRHVIFNISGTITFALLGSQLADYAVLSTAAGGPIVWAMVSALLLVTSSCLAIFRVLPDAHFRKAVLLKGILLVDKTVLLTIPKLGDVVDFKYIWSCGLDSICPPWCKHKAGGGRCVASTGDQCRCESAQPSYLVLALTVTTSLALFMLTLVDIISVFTRLRNLEGALAKL
jgi:hypothetical protein